MTKKKEIPRSSSSSSSREKFSDRKRPKRPHTSSGSGNSVDRNRYRRHSAQTQTYNATTSRFNEGVDEGFPDSFDERNCQRLYHGLCPDVSNRYRKVGDRRIGQGTYGVVYQARDTWKERDRHGRGGDGINRTASATSRNKETNEIVALKKCYAHHEASDGFPITTLREIHALRICSSHPNIVDLLEIAVSSSNHKSIRGRNTHIDSYNKDNEAYDDGDNGTNDSKPRANKSVTQKATIKIGKSNVFLVFEHCRYDLAQILDSYDEHQNRNNRRRQRLYAGSSPFSLPQTKTLIIQLLSALEFCHCHGLVHRDIKPSNLLYDTITGRLKLCDFGLSRTVSETHMTPTVVSLWYRAPEILLPASKGQRSDGSRSDNRSNNVNTNSNRRIKYSFPIDLWATGCVVAELLQGHPFLDGSSEIEQLKKMKDALGPPPSDLYSLPPGLLSNHNISNQVSNHHTTMGLWDRFEHLPPEGLTLLARLLEYDPNERWTAAKALEASFLAPTSKPSPIKDLRTMPMGFPGC